MEITIQQLEMLDYHIEDGLHGVLKDTVLSGFDAMSSLFAFFTEKSKDVPEHLQKQVTVVETGPWVKNYGKQYVLYTEQERQELRQQAPDLVIRLATEEELIQMKALYSDSEEE